MFRPNRGRNRERGVRPLPYGAGVTRLSAETYLTTSAPSPRASARCSPRATPRPGCRRAPTGTRPTCCGTSRRCSDGGPTCCSPPREPEEVEPARRRVYADLLATYDAWSRDLADALEAADPAEEAWTLVRRPDRRLHPAPPGARGADPPRRRRAGRRASPATLDPVLAADGVDEVLAVMYGGCPPWGTLGAGEGLVRVDATDTGEEFWVRFGLFAGTDPDSGTSYADEEDFHVVEPPDDGDVRARRVVDGPAAALDLWLWSRGDDADISARRRPATCSPASARSWSRRSTDRTAATVRTRVDVSPARRPRRHAACSARDHDRARRDGLLGGRWAVALPVQAAAPDHLPGPAGDGRRAPPGTEGDDVMVVGRTGRTSPRTRRQRRRSASSRRPRATAASLSWTPARRRHGRQREPTSPASGTPPFWRGADSYAGSTRHSGHHGPLHETVLAGVRDTASNEAR